MNSTVSASLPPSRAPHRFAELPRAALTAFRIAEAAEFFSFGTNDLTQTTSGFSRDDVEAAFFAAYLSMGSVHCFSVRKP